MKKILWYFQNKYNNWDGVYHALEQRERVKEAELEHITDAQMNDVICIIDADYPDFYKKVMKPPYFVKRSDLTEFFKVKRSKADNNLIKQSLKN